MIEPFPLEGIYAITPSFKKNELAYLEKIEETVRAGVSALQIREKYVLETSYFIRLLKSVRDLCSDYKIKLIMNFKTLLALGVVKAGGLWEETGATQGDEEPVLAPTEDPVYGGLMAGVDAQL